MKQARPRTALYGIVAAVFVSGTGIGSILPILPLYLRERGASYSLVGVIVAASLIAQAIGQWPAGWLADRFGRRETMVAGLLVAAATSLVFVLPLSIGWLVTLRFLQGLGFATATPAERAVVADVVPSDELGVAYAWLSGARQSGLIAGPAIGGLLAVFGRSTVFVATGIALAAAALVAAAALGPTARPTARAGADALVRQAWSPRARRALLAIVVLTIGIGVLIGVYDVIWSLYMRTLGASDFVIGLSFSLFALPLVIATPFAGWASDRWDRRWLAFGSLALTSLIGPIYPFIGSIPLVMTLGVLEATLWSFSEPAMNAFLMEAVRERRGEAQGVVGTALNGAMAVGSLSAGALFAIGPGVPFFVAAAAGIVFAFGAVPALRAAGGRLSAEPEVVSA